MHISKPLKRNNKFPGNFFSFPVVAACLMIVLLIVFILTAYNGAMREVTLLVSGKQWRVCTFSLNVAKLLEEKAITLGKKDQVYPSLTTSLEDGMTVRVDRIKTHIVKEYKSIPYRIEQKKDYRMYKGDSQVVQNGRKGLQCKEWEITFKNGKELEKKLLASKVLQKPINQVVRVGSMQVASRGGDNLRFSQVFDMLSTAYTYTGNNTATGVPPRVGIVAVDPSVIPIGSQLYVEGYGYCQALDTGGIIKGNKIDVFVESESQALSWGKRKVKVYILN